MAKSLLLSVIGGYAKPAAVAPTPIHYDYFTGLANDAALTNRSLPSGTGVWRAGSGAKGDGAGMIKFTSGLKNCKADIGTTVTEAAMRVVMRDFGVSGSGCILWCCDTLTSEDPRFGHGVIFDGRAGNISSYKIDAYTFSLVTSTNIAFPGSWLSSGFNSYTLQRSGTRLDTWVNDVWMASFTTDGSFSAYNRWGVQINGDYNATGRIDQAEWFTVVPVV